MKEKFRMRSIKGVLRGKRVLVRVDFNVPLKRGKVADDKRIRAALPTINLLRKKGARVILMSHLGRPHGKVNEALRMKPVAIKLSKLLKRPVLHVTDCVGPSVEAASKALRNGEVMLLENLRFSSEEVNNNKKFAKKLANLADYYVNDAFAVSHRANASVEAVTRYLPSYAGLELEKELKQLSRIFTRPRRPLVLILGGGKAHDKLGVINYFHEKNKTDYYSHDCL